MKIIHSEFLPTNQRSTHAATVAFHKNHPVFAWFEGTREGAPDVNIRIYNQNGDKESTFIGKDDSFPRWNPVLFEIDNDLYMFEKIGTFCDRWQTIVHNLSNSNGDKREIQILPAGVNASVKTKPIILKDKMYCGSSVETMLSWTSYIEEFSIPTRKRFDLIEFKDRSLPLTVPSVEFEDQFKTKHLSKGLIQPSVWHDGKNLHAFFRSSYGLGRVFYSRTIGEDIKRWTIPTKTNIPNPNSSVDTVFYKDRLFLVCNPSETIRSPLSILELDESLNTIDTFIVDSSSPLVKDLAYSNELSYPYMIEHEGKLHLVYTYGRVKIKYVVVEI